MEALDRIPNDPEFLSLFSHFLKIGVCPRCCLRIFNVRERIYSSKSLSTSSLLQFISSKLPPPSILPSSSSPSPPYTHSTNSNPTFETNACNEGMKDTCLICVGILHSFFGKVQKRKKEKEMDVEMEEKEEEKEIEIEMNSLTESDSVLNQILHFLKMENFEFEDFCLEITLPPFVFAREKALCFYIQQKHLKEKNIQQLNILNENNIISIKEIIKWSLIEPLENELCVKYNSDSNFRIALIYNHDVCEKELNFLFDYDNNNDNDDKRNKSPHNQKSFKHKNKKYKHELSNDENNNHNNNNNNNNKSNKHNNDDDNINDTNNDNNDNDNDNEKRKYSFHNNDKKQYGSFQVKNYLNYLHVGNTSINEWMNKIKYINEQNFEKKNYCPPEKLDNICSLKLFCWRKPIYVAGRYLKFSRNVSQTKWMIDEEGEGEGEEEKGSKRKGDDSVQEIIANYLIPSFECDGYKFISAGREDIDVRMLGNGRPFVFEILNSKNFPNQDKIFQIQKQINSSKDQWVNVQKFQMVGNEMTLKMKEGEEEKQKDYTAFIWLSKQVNSQDLEILKNTKELVIDQKTPIRVLHRRSPLTRKKVIHSMDYEAIPGNNQTFILHLCTQAGTYIKEFVHGDFGRTYPNVGSLLNCKAEILQLDVADVKMDFL